jgi:periplasmic glucans biosynthesis protein
MRRTLVIVFIAVWSLLSAVVLTTAEAAEVGDVTAVAEATPTAAFSFDTVADQARRQAQQPWQAPADTLPAELAALGYDALRDIRFRPERALWRAQGLPFEVQFFHRGGGLRQAVQLNEVVNGRARALTYRGADWDVGGNRFAQGPSSWGDLGYAGFRVHTALNSPAYKDELVVFLGASYFRALGQGQQYGLSARGLALDTVGGTAGEEFPRFSAFWLERPAAGAGYLVVYALLESPRATGAYRFTITPGAETTVQVQARLFLREGATPALATLGIAPLTSMYLHGENQPGATDFRPEVHDSDGLLVAATGPGEAEDASPEWLWRPLVRPGQPLVSSFAVQRLQGFGLMQRDRRFSSYEDTEARYDRRPSAWVEPVGDWGPGRVELLQLPTPGETDDNVVAYWVPAALPVPGQALDLTWRLHWQGDRPQQPPNGWTVQSRRGRSWAQPLPGELKFVVDFDGPALRALPEGSDVTAVATALRNARVLDSRAWPHPQGGWRMQLRVQRDDPKQPVELRAFLQHGKQALTETWTALIPRE